MSTAPSPAPTTAAAPPLPGDAPSRPAAAPRLALLRLLLALSIASTAIHYSHNFAMAGMYPSVPVLFPTELSYQIGIAVFWPLLTAYALWGYRRYLAGDLRRAGRAFIAYSFLGITTVGHFLGGVPEIPPFFFATIFTDFLTGTAILLFGIATLRAAPHPAPSPQLADPAGEVP